MMEAAQTPLGSALAGMHSLPVGGCTVANHCRIKPA